MPWSVPMALKLFSERLRRTLAKINNCLRYCGSQDHTEAKRMLNFHDHNRLTWTRTPTEKKKRQRSYGETIKKLNGPLETTKERSVLGLCNIFQRFLKILPALQRLSAATHGHISSKRLKRSLRRTS